MVRTQIQLPNDLYRDLKRLAEWRLPEARHCGPFLARADEWTEIAHEDEDAS